jgi:hypothetical protein
VIAAQQLDRALDRKRFEDLRAKLAFKRYTLQRMDDSTFLVARWSTWSCPLDSLEAVERFAKRVGAA